MADRESSQTSQSVLDAFNDKMRPFIQPALFGYLTYFFYEASTEAVTVGNAELTNQTLSAMNQYAVVLSMLTGLAALAVFIATWFDQCDEPKESRFSVSLQKQINQIMMASTFQLMSIWVVGNKFKMAWYTTEETAEHHRESVAAGIIALANCLLVYIANVSEFEDEARNKENEKEEDKNIFTKALDWVLGEDRTHAQGPLMFSGVLVLIAWIYNLAQGAFIGPWYEAFTLMLLCAMANVGLGYSQHDVALKVRNGVNLMLHVFIIYFLSVRMGEEKASDNFVALGLVIASAVTSVTKAPVDETKKNDSFSALEETIFRIAHMTVGILALVAVHESDSTDLLYSLASVGAILKIASCFVEPSHLEFVSRNASTLLLLISFASVEHTDVKTIQSVAFWAAILARAVDGFQNSVLEDFTLLGDPKERSGRINSSPVTGKSFDNPIIYVVLAGFITTSVGLVYAGDDACPDGILNPSAVCNGTKVNGTLTSHGFTDDEAMYVRVAIAFVWIHAITAFIGVALAMYNEASRNDFLGGTYWGLLSPSTLELFRTAVATSVIALVAPVAHQAVNQSTVISTWLYVSLFAYVLSDVIGRNVV